jgi:hypothetical protein
MSLATPERIGSPQGKLYCKAKAEPAFRFYTLYEKICRADILAEARALPSTGHCPASTGTTALSDSRRGRRSWRRGGRYPRAWRQTEQVRFTGCSEAFRAQIIACADDFVILSRVPVYRAIDAHVYDRVRDFLCRRHNVSRRSGDGKRSGLFRALPPRLCSTLLVRA